MIYTVFTGRSKRLARSGTLLETVSLVHIQLAAQASLLDVTEQSAAVEETAPDVLVHAHFVRVVDPRLDVMFPIPTAIRIKRRLL